jgi:hypothetical protein
MASGTQPTQAQAQVDMVLASVQMAESGLSADQQSVVKKAVGSMTQSVAKMAGMFVKPAQVIPKSTAC